MTLLISRAISPLWLVRENAKWRDHFLPSHIQAIRQYSAAAAFLHSLLLWFHASRVSLCGRFSRHARRETGREWGFKGGRRKVVKKGGGKQWKCSRERSSFSLCCLLLISFHYPLRFPHSLNRSSSFFLLFDLPHTRDFSRLEGASGSLHSWICESSRIPPYHETHPALSPCLARDPADTCQDLKRRGEVEVS